MNPDDDHPHFDLGFVDLCSDSDEDDTESAPVVQRSEAAPPDLPEICHLETPEVYPADENCDSACMGLVADTEVLQSSQELPQVGCDSEMMPPPDSTSVKKSRHQVKERTFKNPMDELSLDNLTNKQFSDETRKKIRWVQRVYSEWRDKRNARPDSNFISADINDIPSLNKIGLSYTLCRFITEIRRVNGDGYPPKTLYDVVIMIQLHLESHGKYWELLDEKEFKNVRYTLDNVMKERVQKGIGVTVKKTSVLSYEDEEKLWRLGLLGRYNPEQLVRTVIFLLGLHLALRAAKEHCVLRSPGFDSQIEIVYINGVRHLKYVEHIGNKTNKGGLRHKKFKPKEVTVFPNSDKSRCPVATYCQYVNSLPQNRKSSALYLRPKKNYSPGNWYMDTPMGVNAISTVVKKMCSMAGIDGNYTNHSLRATSATRMYQAGTDEHLICEVTGHRSLAVREYKHTNLVQRRVARAALGAPLPDN